VLAAAKTHGIRRFVHISSVAVYGDLTGAVTESSDLQPDSDYGRAKAEAERFCREFQNGGLPIVILRPSNIYGPYGETWTVSYAIRLQSGRWGTFGAQGEGTCNLVYVRDVVEAIRLSLALPQAVGEAFNINGSETLTWNQYFELFAEVLGLPKLKQKDPKGARGRAMATQPVRTLGKYMLKHHRDELVWLCNRSDRFKGLLKGVEERLRSTANLVDMEAYQRKVAYPIEKARQLLSYSPQVSVLDGLVECREWLRHQGLSPSR
jgi:nucleoside-diphosphate-sugar epimerase